MLGITGLLAIFLTAVFAANHKAIFPSAALFTWCVLAYLCVDFGFWHKLFSIRPEDNAAISRRQPRPAMAASLLVFLYTFLRLGVLARLRAHAARAVDRRAARRWSPWRSSIRALPPPLRASSSIAIAARRRRRCTLFLALRGQDRALSLVPTWMLLLVWLFGAGVTLHRAAVGRHRRVRASPPASC